jgi:hypothetical protein
MPTGSIRIDISRGSTMSSEKIEFDQLDRPVWGIEGIAHVINATPKRTEHLLLGGVLDADKFNGRWISTARRLLAQFAGKGPA